MHSRLCKRWWWAALLVLCGILPAPTRGAEDPSGDLVHTGQKGYGLSVFAGGVVERFEVEILGVLPNFQAGSDLILGRLSGHGLEKSGVIAGMSGSPVYIDGRLIGAVALGWPFSHEAVAGITPIAAMRELGEAAGNGSPPRPAAAVRWRDTLPAEGFAERLREVVSGRVPIERWQQAWAPWREARQAGGRSSVLWAGSGLAEGTRTFLEESLASPVAMAGAATALGGRVSLGAEELAPGGAVAAVLIDGDLRLAATGTVTERRGNEVLAFGHPFLGAGSVEVPMAPAEVVTVISSAYSSFKLANFGAPVGSFDVDRRAGIRGEIGRPAPLVPVRVRVGDRDFALGVAPLVEMQPLLFALSLYGALDAVAHTAGRQGLSMTVRYDLDPGGRLELRQDFDGAGAALDAAVYLLGASFLITQNPYAPIDVRRVEVEVERAERPRDATLLSAYPARARVAPGEQAELRLDFRDAQGRPFRRSIAVEVPEEVPDGRYSVLVGSGPALDLVRLGLEASPPQNLGQFLDFLSGLSSRRDLVALGVVPARGLSAAGEAMPHLPGSMRSVLGAGGSPGGVAAAPASANPAAPTAGGLRFAIIARTTSRLEVPIDGVARVEFEVRRRPGEGS